MAVDGKNPPGLPLLQARKIGLRLLHIALLQKVGKGLELMVIFMGCTALGAIALLERTDILPLQRHALVKEGHFPLSPGTSLHIAEHDDHGSVGSHQNQGEDHGAGREVIPGFIPFKGGIEHKNADKREHCHPPHTAAGRR